MKNNTLNEVTGPESVKIEQLCTKLLPSVLYGLEKQPTDTGRRIVRGAFATIVGTNKQDTVDQVYTLVDNVSSLAGTLGESYRIFEEELKDLKIVAVPSFSIPEFSSKVAFYNSNRHSITFHISSVIESIMLNASSSNSNITTSTLHDSIFRLLCHEVTHVIDVRRVNIKKGKNVNVRRRFDSWDTNHLEISAEMTAAIAIVNKEIFSSSDARSLANNLMNLTAEMYITRVELKMHSSMLWLLEPINTLSHEQRRRKRSLEKRIIKSLVYSLRILKQIRPEFASFCEPIIFRITLDNPYYKRER